LRIPSTTRHLKAECRLPIRSNTGHPPTGAYPTLETSAITTTTHRYERTNADPVDMSDGSLHEEQDLLSIPDVGLPIAVSLQYNSRIKYDGPLGKNWKHTYDD
jgi:hypothetical protein